MGDKLLKYYKHVYEMNGVSGRTRLAMETKMPPARAALAPDTPQIIQLFQKAVARITGKPVPPV